MFQSIKIIYAYSNFERTFIEVKDLKTKSKKKDDIYYWFQFTNNVLYHMKFISTKCLSSGIQNRTLKLGNNFTNIYFTDKSMWTHCSNCNVMDRIEKVSDNILNVIENYLNKKRIIQNAILQ